MTAVEDFEKGDYAIITTSANEESYGLMGDCRNRPKYSCGYPFKIEAISLPFFCVSFDQGRRVQVDVRDVVLQKTTKEFYDAVYTKPPVSNSGMISAGGYTFGDPNG